MSLYAVYLRQPAGLHDERHEPFWEFGSFGRTGCHRRNLLSKHSPLQAGDQLAFLQGGAGEVRIVGVTPPLLPPSRRNEYGALDEINWNPTYRPVPYLQAPLLINNEGRTEFPAIVPMIRDAARTTWCGKLGSCFRSRTTPLDIPLAQEILAWFAAADLPRAQLYPDAIMPADQAWHAYACEIGWTDFAMRRTVYSSLGGIVSGSTRCRRTS